MGELKNRGFRCGCLGLVIELFGIFLRLCCSLGLSRRAKGSKRWLRRYLARDKIRLWVSGKLFGHKNKMSKLL